MDLDRAQGLVARGQIEVAPLAFMRGRTLNDCFVILDEAQNATSDQMRMFLTRLGYASRAVVTGDVTQVDLPQGAAERPAPRRASCSRGIEGIAFCTFTEVDVVRHPLVQRIVVAYDQRDAELSSAASGRGGAEAPPEHAPPEDDGEPTMDRRRRSSRQVARTSAARARGRPAPRRPRRGAPAPAARRWSAQGELFVVVAPAAVWDARPRGAPPVRARASPRARRSLVLLGRPAEPDLAQALNRGLGALVAARTPSADELFVAVHSAFELLEAKARAESRGKWLNRYRYELGELIEIAQGDDHRARDRQAPRPHPREEPLHHRRRRREHLRRRGRRSRARRAARCASSSRRTTSVDVRLARVHDADQRRARCPATSRCTKKPLNIADVYDLPALAPFGFDRSLRRASIGYRTQVDALRAAPLARGEVIGVIQLINKKRDPEKKLLTAGRRRRSRSCPSTSAARSSSATLAAQAGIALENAILYAEIQRMLEGFVARQRRGHRAARPDDERPLAPRRRSHASASPAPSSAPTRAPTAASPGHAERPARARVRARSSTTSARSACARRCSSRRRSSSPHQLEIIRARFEFAARSVEVDVLSRKVRAARARARARAELEALDSELARAARRARRARSALDPRARTSRRCSRAATSRGSRRIARETLRRPRRRRASRCSTPTRSRASRWRAARSPTGEIDEIRSHVVAHLHSSCRRSRGASRSAASPIIAGAHHERLNGTGYPNRLRAEEIPLQSKMMSVARHLRRAHRERPPLQEGRPAREGARHPRLRGEGPAHRRATSCGSSSRRGSGAASPSPLPRSARRPQAASDDGRPRRGAPTSSA